MTARVLENGELRFGDSVSPKSLLSPIEITRQALELLAHESREIAAQRRVAELRKSCEVPPTSLALRQEHLHDLLDGEE